MQLDVTSLLAVASVVVALLAIAMLYFYFQDRRASWLGIAVVPLVAGLISMLLFTQRSGGPDFVGKGIGTAVILLGNAMLWQAMRAFDRRRVLVLPVILVPGAWLALSASPVFMEPAFMPLRLTVASFALSLLCGLAAWELWRGRAEALPSRNVAIGVLGLLALAHWARVPLMKILPFPLGGLPTTAWAVGGMVAFTALVTLYMTLLLISMTKERWEQAQRHISVTDPLTGLLNRRAFADEAESMARLATGAAIPITLLVLDLDHFKTINDRYGHEAGDYVLRSFSAITAAHARTQDMVFRMGGEEFCFLLPGMGADMGAALAQRICREFGNSFVATPAGEIRATVSIGVATADTDDVPIGNLLAAADAALYEAKNSGRDQVVSARTSAVIRLGDEQVLRFPGLKRA